MNFGYVILLGILTVLLLAWVVLSLKLRRTRSEKSVIPDKHPSSQPSESPEDITPEALVLGPLESPLLEIRPTALTENAVPLPSSTAMKTALQPILQRAPELFGQGSRMAQQGYKIVFSPEVTRALRSGTMELMPSGGKLLPIARDATKGSKIVEVGRFAKGGGIKLAGVAAASWQVLSIVTAQHFLNEINARLAGIEDGIKDIRNWLQDDKRTQLTAAVGHLRDAHAAIKRGDLHPEEIRALYGQLETLELNARGIGELAKRTAERRITELHNIQINDYTDRPGSAKRALDWLHESKNVIDLMLLAQAMRVLCCQVKALLPGDRQRLADRLADTKLQVNAAASLFDSTREAYLQKLTELRKRNDNPLAAWGIFDKDHRRDLENEFAITREAVTQAAIRFEQQTRSALEMTQRLDALADEGMALEVRINNEGEMEVFQLPPQAA